MYRICMDSRYMIKRLYLAEDRKIPLDNDYDYDYSYDDYIQLCKWVSNPEESMDFFNKDEAISFATNYFKSFKNWYIEFI